MKTMTPLLTPTLQSLTALALSEPAPTLPPAPRKGCICGTCTDRCGKGHRHETTRAGTARSAEADPEKVTAQ